DQRAILSYYDEADIMRCINSVDAPELSQVGGACPDHLVHTKRTPLYIDWSGNAEDLDSLKEAISNGVGEYRNRYVQYCERNKHEAEVLRDASPRIILVPGVGLISTGKNKAMADNSAGLYKRAISVMRGSTSLGAFTSLTENESYNVEYWPLELYKLTLAPP